MTSRKTRQSVVLSGRVLHQLTNIEELEGSITLKGSQQPRFQLHATGGCAMLGISLCCRRRSEALDYHSMIGCRTSIGRDFETRRIEQGACCCRGADFVRGAGENCFGEKDTHQSSFCFTFCSSTTASLAMLSPDSLFCFSFVFSFDC